MGARERRWPVALCGLLLLCNCQTRSRCDDDKARCEGSWQVKEAQPTALRKGLAGTVRLKLDRPFLDGVDLKLELSQAKATKLNVVATRADGDELTLVAAWGATQLSGFTAGAPIRLRVYVDDGKALERAAYGQATTDLPLLPGFSVTPPEGFATESAGGLGAPLAAGVLDTTLFLTQQFTEGDASVAKLVAYAPAGQGRPEAAKGALSQDSSPPYPLATSGLGLPTGAGNLYLARACTTLVGLAGGAVWRSTSANWRTETLTNNTTAVNCSALLGANPQSIAVAPDDAYLAVLSAAGALAVIKPAKLAVPIMLPPGVPAAGPWAALAAGKSGLAVLDMSGKVVTLDWNGSALVRPASSPLLEGAAQIVLAKVNGNDAPEESVIAFQKTTRKLFILSQDMQWLELLPEALPGTGPFILIAGKRQMNTDENHTDLVVVDAGAQRVFELLNVTDQR